MANEIKELSKFCNDPKYREKVIARVHKDMDKEYNQRIKAIEAQKNTLITSRNNEIARISKSRWESYAQNRLMVNRTEGTISVNNAVHYFSSINGAQINMIPGYRVVSTETATTKGRKHASIGGAIVGGMIAGPVGAVVGGSALGKTKSKTRGTVVTNQIPTCMHLGVVVTLNGFANEIPLITQQVDQSSSAFVRAYQEAQNMVALLSSLAMTPVPQYVLRPEDEQSVKLLDAQIYNKQQELEVARANVPTYALPAMYRTAEQSSMSDEEYLQYLREADSQRLAQTQYANNQNSTYVQEATVIPMVQQAQNEATIDSRMLNGQAVPSYSAESGSKKATSVIGKIFGWIVSSVLFLAFLIFLLLLTTPQDKVLTAIAIFTMLILSLQITLINPLLSELIPSKSFLGWIKRHRIPVAAILVGVWLTGFLILVMLFPSNGVSSQFDSKLEEQRIEEITEKWENDGIVDYTDLNQFEQDLNSNARLEGKTVSFKVTTARELTELGTGYALEGGNSIVFISQENPEIKEGTTITVIVTGVTTIIGGGYRITYVILEK